MTAGTGGQVPAQAASWRDRALCAEMDPELFFPEPGEPTGPAKRVCRACEVRAECLRFALDRGERFGVWGGLSVAERLDLARQQRPGVLGDAARSDAA